MFGVAEFPADWTHQQNIVWLIAHYMLVKFESVNCRHDKDKTFQSNADNQIIIEEQSGVD